MGRESEYFSKNPKSMCAHWHSRKSRSFCPRQQLAREPPRSRDTNQKRERTPQPSKERKPGTNHRKPAQNKNRNQRKTQTPTASQPPEPRKRKQPNGNGRRQRRPSARKNGLKDGSTRTKHQPPTPNDAPHRGTEQLSVNSQQSTVNSDMKLMTDD